MRSVEQDVDTEEQATNVTVFSLVSFPCSYTLTYAHVAYVEKDVYYTSTILYYTILYCTYTIRSL